MQNKCLSTSSISSTCCYIHISLFWFKQLPQVNPGFNNAPFKFTKYSNAYMLVYIRESDKEKVMCTVDEKDIAEHLRVCKSVVVYHHFDTLDFILVQFG
jgi:hypothetical protein